MALSQSEFQKAYSMLLGSIWANPANLAKLQKDPVGYLNATGFGLPRGEKVILEYTNVGAADGGQAGLEMLYGDYLEATKTSKPLTMYIAVHGPDPTEKGMARDTYCCCCSPCCTCT